VLTPRAPGRASGSTVHERLEEAGAGEDRAPSLRRLRLGSEAPTRGRRVVEEVEPAEAGGGGAQIAGHDAMLGERLSGTAVAPEQRHDHGPTA